MQEKIMRKSMRRMSGVALALILAMSLAAIGHDAYAQDRNAPVDLTIIPGRGEGDAASPRSTLRRSGRDAATPDTVARDNGGDTEGGDSDDASPANLATIGIATGEGRDAVDGLDRFMWDGATLDDVILLYEYLPPRIGARALDDRLNYIVAASALPPIGGEENITPLVFHRIDRLQKGVRGEDFATLVRALPYTEPWLIWRRWLVMHDFITRNDAAGCAAAARPGLLDEDLAHKITAFCHVVADDRDKARLALDILSQLGEEAKDPFYFALMRKLLDGSDAPLPATADITILHLVLMDSAEVEIPAAALTSAEAWRGSLKALRNLAPDAVATLAAKNYDAAVVDAGSAAVLWAGLPQSDIAGDVALARFADGRTPTAIALSRLRAWQAASRAGGKQASDLALAAFAVDFGYTGARGLQLWSPFMTDGGKGAVLKALVPNVRRSNLTGAARGWAEILAVVDGGGVPQEGFNPQYIADAGAADALPMLAVFGITGALPADRQSLLAPREPLAGNRALPIGRLAAFETAVARLDPRDGRGEVVMLAALAVGETPSWELERDSAALLVRGLMAAGLEVTARQLAREILTGWVVGRTLADTDTPTENAESTGNGSGQ